MTNDLICGFRRKSSIKVDSTEMSNGTSSAQTTQKDTVTTQGSIQNNHDSKAPPGRMIVKDQPMVHVRTSRPTQTKKLPTPEKPDQSDQSNQEEGCKCCKLPWSECATLPELNLPGTDPRGPIEDRPNQTERLPNYEALPKSLVTKQTNQDQIPTNEPNQTKSLPNYET